MEIIVNEDEVIINGERYHKAWDAMSCSRCRTLMANLKDFRNDCMDVIKDTKADVKREHEDGQITESILSEGFVQGAKAFLERLDLEIDRIEKQFPPLNEEEKND